MKDLLKMFIPIYKIDEEKRLIYGKATEEQPDSAGEVFDFDTSRPYFQKWTEYFKDATDGKSFGNLRAMHEKKAIGILPEVILNGIDKAVEVVAKVVDQDEWQKVLEGVYTGFSQGGRYIKKWFDGKVTRYTAEPTEISLVDYPCLKTATFQVVKSDGIIEERNFTKKAEEKPLKKYLGDEIWDARRALECLDTIQWMWAHERDEGDTAQAADLKTVVDKLKSFISSEIMEDGEAMALAEKTGDLHKTAEYCPNCGCKKCNDTRSKMKKLSKEDEMEKEQFDAIMKKLDDQGALIATVQAENTDLKKRLETSDAKIAELQKPAAIPEPAAVAITDTGIAVSKAQDTGGLKKEEEIKDPLQMIRKAHEFAIPLKPGTMPEDLRKAV
jgi:hypothetical protein